MLFFVEWQKEKMEERIKISKEQIIMSFVATCIETTARQLGTDYNEIYKRMKM